MKTEDKLRLVSATLASALAGCSLSAEEGQNVPVQAQNVSTALTTAKVLTVISEKRTFDKDDAGSDGNRTANARIHIGGGDVQEN